MLRSLPATGSRRVTMAFLAIAAVSTGLLGVLGWLLLKQDVALEQSRVEERHAQAADRFAAHVQPLLADPAGGSPLPPAVTRITIDAGQVSVGPEALLYYPHERSRHRQASDQVFADGERFEYVIGDYASAQRAYAALAASADPPVRAGALGRLARVQRKRLDIDAALATYDRLAETPEGIDVSEFPATLYARLGRASALQVAKRGDELRTEVEALWADLQNGRWMLSVSEYGARRQEVREWLSEFVAERSDRLALAEAVAWIWLNRQLLSAPGHRSLTLQSGPVLIAWTPADDRLRAAVAGSQYISSVLDDVRTEGSSRRVVLAVALGAVGLVLLAGWYFILRSLARERRALGLQSDFVAAVSHEFRSPLTSMAHLVEMLDADRLPPESTRTSYRMLVRDTHRLRRLVETLLDFRRFEVGAAHLRLEPIDAVGLVQTTVADFRADAAPPGYVIDVCTPHASIRIDADREALARAIWNLLDNAVKYSPDCRTVWVVVSREPDHIAITVSDRGIGIPLDEQHHVFERFTRGAQAKALRIKGTGIGLAMVRQIVRAHGGDVRVASEPGEGSRFTLLLHEAEETTS